MSGNFVQSAFLRKVALSGLQSWARLQAGRRGPKLLINSIPKSGTHLATNLLRAVPELMDSRLHMDNLEVMAPFYESDAKAGRKQQESKADPAAFRRRLGQLRPGQFASAHLFWDPALPALAEQERVELAHMIRDPRDMLVSRLHYITGLRRHYLHEFLTTRFATDEERMLALIRGPRPGEPTFGGQFQPYADVLSQYEGWLDAPGVHLLRFEMLAGDRGGVATAAEQREAFAALLDHIGLSAEIDKVLNWAIAQKSPTLRRGRANVWRESFTPRIETVFLQEIGSLVARMGYEI